MGLQLRLSGDVLEEDVPPEVLVEVQKSVFGGLFEAIVTSPCCWKVSMLNFISSLQKKRAKGAISRPKRVDLRKR